MLDEREKPPLRDGGLSGTSSDCFDNSEIKPPRSKAQIKFQDLAEAEFDAEIALSLTASGWRAAACLLTHAALLIEAGDYLSAERNRQRAREQFIEANDLFRQFQEMMAAEAVSLYAAQAFR
jgi:hypothetical protein